MRTKVTLVLVFLNVALFFFIFKFERAWRTQDQLLEARRRVLGAEAADIRSLEVTGAAGAFRLERRGDAWWLTKPLEWPANLFAVTGILSELKLLENETSFSTKDLEKNNQKLADYGLDHPKLTVAFTSGNSTTPVRLQLGDTTKVGQRLYLLSPDGERIHVVSRALADSLSLPIAQLRADTLLTIPVFEARSLTIRSAAGARVSVRLDTDRTRWSFETPITARASKPALDLTISELNALHAANFNPPAPATALPPSAAPALRVTLEGNNRRETLFLGDPLGAAAITAGAATSPDVEYYAQLEGRAALFTLMVPAKLIERLRNAQEALREKQILDFDPRTVTAVTLTAPNQPPLTLQRLEAAANAPAEAAWQIVRRSDGAQGPQTLTADRTAVKRLLEQLAALAAKKFQNDAPAAVDLENWGFNRPEREVIITCSTAPGPQPAARSSQLTLQLGNDAAGKVYARLANVANGSSIYEVEPDIVRELPVALRAWRDRQVRDPLPAVARITALKLTDLANNTALVDLAFDDAGAPKTKLENQKSVDVVLAQLRSLRAKSFVQDTFTERMMLAGEERPWKYQLDTTVSLPGGTGGGQTTVNTLYLTERGGGAQQLAGVKEAGAVFEIEQAFLDALWSLTYRDPGPPPPAK